ncbi:MAG TPA: hypothetical protein VNB90_12155 [Cytophagaceae bacterium]|nr:hypothetical protein [Cytophagaceae bacterium]
MYKTIRIITILLLLFVSINALVAGYLFMLDPSGRYLHISTSWLQYSPFTSFFIPGLILFVANGLLTLVTLLFTFLKWKYYEGTIIVQGLILNGWIVVQVILLQKIDFLHYIFFGIGLLLLVSGVILSHLKK